MVYVGTYHRDTDMYRDNDTIIQDDSKASYKAYLDLETQEAYNIAIEEVSRIRTRTLDDISSSRRI